MVPPLQTYMVSLVCAACLLILYVRKLLIFLPFFPNAGIEFSSLRLHIGHIESLSIYIHAADSVFRSNDMSSLEVGDSFAWHAGRSKFFNTWLQVSRNFWVYLERISVPSLTIPRWIFSQFFLFQPFRLLLL